jgi:ERCC4-related helicase
MSIEWIEHRLIKSKSLEKREYQVNIAKVALNRNTLVVLPTGLGKTTIALLLAVEMLDKGKKSMIFAPTRVLVNQHYNFFKEHIIEDKEDDIALVTGSSPLHEREEVWSTASIVCSTPQVALNDANRGILSIDDFSLLMFDEAHRAVGDYAYTMLARLSNNARIVGFTATLPDNKDKVIELAGNLKIERIEVRSEDSLDVRAYIKDTKVEFVEVELTTLFKDIRGHILNALNSKLELLRSYNIIDSLRVSARDLIRIGDELDVILAKVNETYNTNASKEIAEALYSAIRLNHALKVLDTQGLVAFTSFYERLSERRGLGVKTLVNHDLKYAYELARGAEISGIEHPKLSKLVEILDANVKSNNNARVLIFTSYRDSVYAIYNKLKELGFRVGYLIGKSGTVGLRQDEQLSMVSKFRDGEYNILVATSVGEEGLDIAECNLVIFYDNVPSAIRFVQRKGRTGRRMSGRVIVLVTKDTIDEAYYWISRKKVKEVNKVVGIVNSILANKDAGKRHNYDNGKRLDYFL